MVIWIIEKSHLKRQFWYITENKEFHPELKIINKEAQLAMSIVWRYVESRASIAHETFKTMLHLEILTEFEREKTCRKLY